LDTNACPYLDTLAPQVTGLSGFSREPGRPRSFHTPGTTRPAPAGPTPSCFVSGIANAKNNAPTAAIAASETNPASNPAAFTTNPAIRLLNPAPMPEAVASAPCVRLNR